MFYKPNLYNPLQFYPLYMATWSSYAYLCNVNIICIIWNDWSFFFSFVTYICISNVEQLFRSAIIVIYLFKTQVNLD